MELRLLRYDEGELEPDEDEPAPPDTPEALASSIVELLRHAMDKGESVWQDITGPAVQNERLAELTEAKELRSMVEVYLEQSDDDPGLLEDLHDEIMQQKIYFADAVIEEWIKDQMSEAYDRAQEKRIRQMLGGKAIRLTPITKDSINKWLNEGTPPDELFYEGYVASVSTLDGAAALSMTHHADGSGPVTGDLLVWRRDHRTGEVIQEAKLEVIEASEIGQ